MIIQKIIRNGLAVSRIVRGGVILWKPISDVPKLETPAIYLETTSDGNTSDRTPAILGVAVLGKTILGDYSSGLTKLDAPQIRIETAQELIKLDAPVIRLETEVEPEEPVIQKLNTPVIYLHIEEPEVPDEPDEPIVVKLSTPVIELVTVSDPTPPEEPDEPDVPIIPDEPIIQKLDTPVIRLETVAEPEEPEVPEEPEIIKLATPEIYLEKEVVEVPKLATPVILLEESIIPEQTFTFSKNANYNYYQYMSSSDAIDDAWADYIAQKCGETFGVEWDGTTYEVTAFDPYTGTSSAGSCTCLGNGSITDNTLEDTGEPFVLLNALWMIYFRTKDTSETHTVRVYKI